PPPSALDFPFVPLDCPGPAGGGTAVTLIRWRPEDALLADRDLSRTVLAGNLIVASQALTHPPLTSTIDPPSDAFAIPPLSDGDLRTAPAIVRAGPNDSAQSPSLQYLYTLRSSPVAWVQPADPTARPAPELLLTSPASGDDREIWSHVRWLLDAGPSD